MTKKFAGKFVDISISGGLFPISSVFPHKKTFFVADVFSIFGALRDVYRTNEQRVNLLRSYLWKQFCFLGSTQNFPHNKLIIDLNVSRVAATIQ